jgi:hypothetical protein
MENHALLILAIKQPENVQTSTQFLTNAKLEHNVQRTLIAMLGL